jgi:type I restriction enzyme R subunit
VDTGTVERKRSVPLKSLLDAVAVGAVDDDLLVSLARRLSLMAKRLSPKQRQDVETLLDVPGAPESFTSLRQLSNALLDATDADCIRDQAVQDRADPAAGPTEQELEAARQKLVQRAVLPLAASPELRGFLLEREMLIDETSVDAIIEQGFSSDATLHARQLVQSFQEFISTHKDEITALQILYNRPYAQRRLDFSQVRELAEQLDQHLHQADPLFLTEELWQAYAKLQKDRVRGAGEKRILADLVSLVRHAALDEELEPYSERVQRRYQEWLAARTAYEKAFSPQQRWWLDEIARQIGINVSLNLDDLNYFDFQARGGQVAALRLFGTELGSLIEELNLTLGA